MGVAWPNPRFTDNGNGTVTDNMTGLIWLKNAKCTGATNWNGVLAFANSLYDGWTGDGSGGDCGLRDGSSAGDWRLPNVKELWSLTYYGATNPVVPNTAGTGQWIESDPFNGVWNSLYWSSTTHPVDSGYAWGVRMSGGQVESNSWGSLGYVWPVRGGN